MDLTPAITTMALAVEPKNISNLPCHATTPNNYYYYYKCHGLECCHHIVAGALYKNLDLNCCTAQCRCLLTIGVDGATSAV